MRPRAHGAVLLMLGVLGMVVQGQGGATADHLDVRLMMGRFEFSRALERTEELIQLYPDSLFLYATYAEVAQYAKSLDRAQKFLEARIDYGAGLGQAYFGLGCVLLRNEDSEGATASFGKCLDVGCTDLRVYRLLVSAYEQSRSSDATIDHFLRMSHREPEIAGWWVALALSNWRSSDPERILYPASEALKLHPDSDPLADVWRVMLVRSAKYELAVREIRGRLSTPSRMIDLDEKFLLKSNLAFALLRLSKPDLAELTANELVHEASRFGYLRWVGWGYAFLAEARFSSMDYDWTLHYSSLARRAFGLAREPALADRVLGIEVDSFLELGLPKRALEQALERELVDRVAGMEVQHASAMLTLARIFSELGAGDLSLEFGLAAFSELDRITDNPGLLFRVHTTIGNTYLDLGHLGAASRHLMTAHEHAKLGNLGSQALSISHGNLAACQLALKNIRKAERHVFAQLRIARRIGFQREVAYGLLNAASVCVARRDTASALKSIDKSIRIARKMGQVRCLQLALRRKRDLVVAQGKNDMALAANSELLVSERLSDRLLGVQTSKTKNLVAQDIYVHVDLLINKGLVDSAIGFLEAAHDAGDPRRWRRMLRKSHSRSGGSATDALEEVQRHYRSFAVRFLWPQWPQGIADQMPAFCDLLRAEVRWNVAVDSLIQSENVIEYVTRVSTGLGQLVKSNLGSNEAAIEFLIGEERSSVMVVTRTHLRAIPIPVSRRALVALRREVSPILDLGRRRIALWNAQIAGFSPRHLDSLSAVLMTPIWDIAGAKDTWYIIASDVLSGIPVEMLHSRDLDPPRCSNSGGPFLIADHTICYLPSIGRVVDTEASSGWEPEKAKPMSQADGMGKGRDFVNQPLWPSRSDGASKGDILQRLPGSKIETDMLEKYLPSPVIGLAEPVSGMRMLYEKEDSIMVVHASGHGEYNGVCPAFSWISITDGIAPGVRIYAFELDIRWPRARLSVLSGCATLGHNGEQGLDGVGSFILDNLSEDVVGTLWQVDDDATAALMVSMYGYLQEGKPLGEALRHAKLAMIESGTHDPFRWAGAVVYGKGNQTFRLGERHSTAGGITEIAISAGFLLVVGIAFWRWRSTASSSLARLG